jgi:2-dehydropantoate 2-reductase
MFKRWFHSFPRLAADVIVVNDKSVLLIERKFPPYGWAIPGGMAELGETIERTAVRELEEETGISVTEDQLTLLGVYSDPARDFRGHTVGAVYYTYSSEAPVAADDAKNARYFPLNELPELAFDHAKVLQDLVTRLGIK